MHRLDSRDPEIAREIERPVEDLLDRGGHSLTEMPRAGQALAVGGVNASGQLQAAAIVFSASGATITTDQTNYAPGQTVVITGAGWKRGETVNMVLHEEPTTDPDRTLTSVADKKGNFTNDSFVVQPNDAGVTFTLTATGQTSGLTAQTTFADATSTNLTTVNVSQIGPATAAPGASRVPILSFTVHTGAAAGEKLKRVRTYWNSSATTADVIQTVYLYRGERRSAWISIFGRFGGHTVGFHDAPTGTCSSEANIDNPDLNLAANTDFTFYIVVDVKATAVLWNAVDFRVNQDRLEFNSGTWPPAAQSVSGTSPCPVAANTWNPAGSTTVGDPSVFSYSPSTQDFGGGATSCVVS
ncbi:MAG: hypothetical protein DMG09_26460 [Acidobacteria bacterium]|nr:MAG: hypothetical protein DMG09_26460 [Acidobacteriota bacterium]